MNKLTLERLLNRYSEYWSGSGVAMDDLSSLSPAVRTELDSVMRLVGLLHETLVPVQPRDEFVEELRRSLLAEAIRRQSWRSVYLSPLRKHWKLTAAATASGVGRGCQRGVGRDLVSRPRQHVGWWLPARLSTQGAGQ
ncbi:MAG: hypothetical protein R2844_23415 [Caldilineales bacterium]